MVGYVGITEEKRFQRHCQYIQKYYEALSKGKSPGSSRHSDFYTYAVNLFVFPQCHQEDAALLGEACLIAMKNLSVINFNNDAGACQRVKDINWSRDDGRLFGLYLLSLAIKNICHNHISIVKLNILNLKVDMRKAQCFKLINTPFNPH